MPDKEAENSKNHVAVGCLTFSMIGINLAGEWDARLVQSFF